MSPARRRSRSRRPDAAAAQPATAASAPGSASPTLPRWQWRTFPVYFAFSFALFLGFQAGLFIGVADSASAAWVGSIVVTVLLAVGASRFWSVWMMRRGWIKPRAQKRR